MKKTPPGNLPTLMCVSCGKPAPALIKWASDDSGTCFPVHVDMWPEYYWDVADHRHEFCSAACVLKWRQSMSTA